jgi:hypothetical protein
VKVYIYLLGKRSTTLAIWLFWGRFCIMSCWPDYDPPICASLSSGMTVHITSPSFYWLKWNLTNILPGLTSNCSSPELCFLIATITGMSHVPS